MTKAEDISEGAGGPPDDPNAPPANTQYTLPNT